MDLWDIARIAVIGAVLFMAFCATFEYIAFREQNEKKDGTTE